MSVDYFFQILEPILMILGLASLAIALIIMWIKRRAR